MKLFHKLTILSTIIAVSFWLALPSLAVDCESDPPKSDPEQIKQYQQKCEEKINQLQGEAKTLEATISLLNSQINLTQSKIISVTEEIETLNQEISTLGTVITDLDKELDDLASVYIQRIRESYKNRQITPLTLFLSSKGFNTFQNQIKYLETAQERDQIILKELEKARFDFDQQKTTKELKQQEVEALQLKLEQQQSTLASQQKEKALLLSETKNSEKVYQDRLAKAVAELKAIESIIAGQGSEVQVGAVNENQQIASIIQGASACSTGTHLHFEVVESKIHKNPADYLSSRSVIWNNEPDNPFSFNGSWNWPLDDPIRITQGYGNTSYSGRYANNKHTGIDMTSQSNSTVKAVRSGTLYRGSIPCGGGTLKYVHVKHTNDNFDTYYLHVNYF